MKQHLLVVQRKEKRKLAIFWGLGEVSPRSQGNLDPIFINPSIFIWG